VSRSEEGFEVEDLKPQLKALADIKAALDRVGRDHPAARHLLKAQHLFESDQSSMGEV
jgi:hypothetical protein